MSLCVGQDPKRYIEAAKAEKGRKYLKSIKEYDAGTYERIVKGDTEALQDFLRARKQASARVGSQRRHRPLLSYTALVADALCRLNSNVQEGEREKLMESMPPPPPTPYDEVPGAKVGMSMRILTDEGEEKDLYMLKAAETDDEKKFLPPHLRCGACQAVAYQGAVRIERALLRRKLDELVSIVATEAVQELCGNQSFWTGDYGLVPTKRGVNSLKGPGIPELPEGDSFEGDTSVMMQTMHSGQWGERMVNECLHHLEGGELDEVALAAIIADAMPLTDQAGGYKAVLQPKICFQPGQPCGEALTS